MQVSYLLLLFLGLPLVKLALCSTNSRQISFSNKSGRDVKVFWVNKFSDELVTQFEKLRDGSSDGVTSYLGHVFLVIELLHDDEVNRSPREVTVEVSKEHGQVFNILENFTIEYRNSKTKSKEQAETFLAKCSENFKEDEIDDLLSCIGSEMVDKIWSVREEFTFHANLASRQRNEVSKYICSDQNLRASEPSRKEEWVKEDHEIASVDILHEDEYSNIHLMKNFISEEECDEILSNSNSQFSILGPRGLTNEKYLDFVSQRVYEYANFYTTLGLEQVGQEDLHVFRKTKTNYTTQNVQCDGECHGIPFQPGQRVATIINFCNVTPANNGGYIHFHNTGVTVIPEQGMTLFYSYLNPNLETDIGYTEYTECPISNGEQSGIKHFFRKDVSSDNPWSYWDLLYKDQHLSNNESK